MGEPFLTESRKSEKERWEATVAGSADGRGEDSNKDDNKKLGHLPTVCITY
jgi:hypothetical protein